MKPLKILPFKETEFDPFVENINTTIGIIVNEGKIFKTSHYYEFDFSPILPELDLPLVKKDGELLGSLYDNKDSLKAFSLLIEGLSEEDYKRYVEFSNLANIYINSSFSVSISKNGDSYINSINISLNSLYNNLKCLILNESSDSYNIEKLIVKNDNHNFKKIYSFNPA